MRRTVSAGLFTVALILIAAAGAVIWREVSESPADDRRIAITADFIGRCQSENPECARMVHDAMAWAVARHRLTRACLSKRPSARTMARGTVIWLNAHAELHPLPAEEGIAKAADAIWPCKTN